MTVLDTNIVIYLLEGRLAQPIAAAHVAISVVTEIELLSHPNLSKTEEATIRDFLGSILIVPLTADVKEHAIRLRRQHGLKIPDAIVAATASVADGELLTNDTRLAATPGVRCRALDLKPA